MGVRGSVLCGGSRVQVVVVGGGSYGEGAEGRWPGINAGNPRCLFGRLNRSFVRAGSDGGPAAAA